MGEDVSLVELWHTALYATLVGGAFLRIDVFSDLQRMPYVLTQGDIAANVQRTKETNREHLVEE